MASNFPAYLDSRKKDELADIVSYLCLMPFANDDGVVFTRRLVRQQKRGYLENLIADFIKDPTTARRRSSKANTVMTKETVV